MTTSSITPEVVGIESQPQILEELTNDCSRGAVSPSPHGDQIKAAQLDKMERDLADNGKEPAGRLPAPRSIAALQKAKVASRLVTGLPTGVKRRLTA